MIHIGTSGWHYRHWVGPFYPDKTTPARFLEFYVQRFHTVEINNSFYRLPSDAALEAWKNAVPKGFIFAVKASRFITHMKKLQDAGGSFQKFFDRVHVLGKTLGPILFQLPPHWHANPERLEEFLHALPKRLRYAFEFRDPSWFVPEVETVLRKRRAATCIFEFEHWLSPRTVTADFVYVRLHGPAGRYQGQYSDDVLAEWAGQFREWDKAGKDVYCYFDNDQAGYAAQDALRLQAMISPGRRSIPA